jgi:hypothetical protein
MNGAQINFGTCWGCLNDVTQPAVMVSGNLVVAQAIFRRWTTPRGRLIDDPNYGYDLTQFLSSGLTQGQLAVIASNAQAEAKKDERVVRCPVSITLIGGVFAVSGNVFTASGPFQLVVSVSGVTPTLLAPTS